MITDQRNHYRVSLFLPGDLSLRAQGGETTRILIRDACGAGLCLETLQSYEPGDMLYVDFELVGRFRFQRLPVTVSRCVRDGHGYLTGVHFRQGEDKRRVLHALVFALENAN
jgi:hypothetical protein